MAASFYGADVDQLRQAGQRLNQAADALERITATIGQQVGRTQWHGPDADRFRGDWEGDHRRALTVAASSLRDAATTLSRNADAQQWASQADAPSSGAGAHSPGLGAALGTLAFKDYATAVRDAADSVLAAKLPDTRWSVDDLFGLIPRVGTGVTIYDGISKLTHGQIPWHEGVDLVSDIVGKSGTPVAYGIGVDMRLWADVVETGQHFFSGDTANGGMDWSAQGMSDLWNGIRNPQVLAETARDTVSQLAPMLAGVFEP